MQVWPDHSAWEEATVDSHTWGKALQTRRQKWTSLSVGDGLISDFHFLLETFLHFPNVLQRLGMNAIRKKNPQMFLFKQTAPLLPVAVTRAWLPMLVGSQGHMATRKGCRRGGRPWPPTRDCFSSLALWAILSLSGSEGVKMLHQCKLDVINPFHQLQIYLLNPIKNMNM